MTDDVRRELVLASHILAERGVVDGFGHVSARDPDDPGAFLISRSLAPALVGDADLMRVDLDGVPIDDARTPCLERFMPAAIYRARADVMAVVHSHSPSVIPFAIVPGAPLRPTFHMCGFLGEGAPVFEIRNHAGGASDLLIRSVALGAALAETLGEGTTVLMRGHGSTVVGQTLRHAVFRAVYLEVNARVQIQAATLGSATFLTAEEAVAASATSDGQVGRAWDLWARAVQGSER